MDEEKNSTQFEQVEEQSSELREESVQDTHPTEHGDETTEVSHLAVNDDMHQALKNTLKEPTADAGSSDAAPSNTMETAISPPTNSRKEPFVNTGLVHWENSRKSWLARSDTDSSSRPTAAPLDIDDIIDIIFANQSTQTTDGPRRFPQAVPLPQMVDILQDLWEAEGLDV